VNVNGIGRTVSLVDPHVVEVRLTEADVAAPGVLAVELRHSGDPSAPTATAPLNVCPRLDRVTASADDPLRLQVEGAGFVAGITATVEGETRSVELVDAEHVVVAADESDRADAPSRSLTIANPAEAGGPAAPCHLTAIEGGNP
jgi:hypothetical protein